MVEQVEQVRVVVRKNATTVFGCSILAAVVLVLIWLTLWARRILDPWLGSCAWAAAIALTAYGVFALRSRHVVWGWGATSLGLSVGLVGLSSVVALIVETTSAPGLSGGSIGSFVAYTLRYLVSAFGALIISVTMVLIGAGIAVREVRG